MLVSFFFPVHEMDALAALHQMLPAGVSAKVPFLEVKRWFFDAVFPGLVGGAIGCGQIWICFGLPEMWCVSFFFCGFGLSEFAEFRKSPPSRARYFGIEVDFKNQFESFFRAVFQRRATETGTTITIVA